MARNKVNTSRPNRTAPIPGKLYAPRGTSYAAELLYLIATDRRCMAHAAGMIASVIAGAIAVVGLVVMVGPDFAR
ncbi:hypothetical protein LWE61_15110 [Sphingobium sufflavum]|uniref:hypothetical protein n=1 Tax=Sphingobium sufflavum TaxID=1129547 RepID=UPI001F18586A|nr:hypothetical protein [Sphingobium sufflavum]MCE7797878.1 hypothetical protein [Sphingobium sufflavum]